MHSLYTKLINPLNPPLPKEEVAAEKRSGYHTLTERHIQAMWLEQKYFKSLKTPHLEIIEVLSPGIWNSEAGPDFLKAHLKIGDRELRGDIELHLTQESWYRHHHHLDPNYNQVILHLCYWPPVSERSTWTSESKAVIQAYLRDCLTIPEMRIAKLIDLDLYPYKRFSASGKCSKTLFNILPEEETVTLLRSAACWRMKQKKERLEEKLGPSPSTFMGGIAMVLGYKHNADAFLEIFRYLAFQKPQKEKALLPLALGIAGFFSSQFEKKWGKSAYYRQLKQEFSLESVAVPLIPLRLDKIRPANHPVRRLALLIKAMNDPTLTDLKQRLFSLWESGWDSSSKKKWKEMRESFFRLIPSYEDSYWSHHYTFEQEKQNQSIALVGEDLKKEILINVFLPAVYAAIEERSNPVEIQSFTEFFSTIPAVETKKSAYLYFRFFGDKQKKILFSKADLQQGAYQIHRDFCLHFEASCQGCPFVDRYKGLQLSTHKEEVKIRAYDEACQKFTKIV